MENFRERHDIAKKVNKIDAQTKHLEDKKQEIETNIKFLRELREIYFKKYLEG